MLRLNRRSLAIATLALFASLARAQTITEAIAGTPLVAPQADGTIDLPVESATVVKWIGLQARTVHGSDSALVFEHGGIVRWSGDIERPAWRVQIPAAGWYRVVITEQTPAGEEHTASVEFLAQGKRNRIVSKAIAASASPQPHPLEMGELELEAGEQAVEFRPVSWVSPYEQGKLFDLRLIPLEPIRKLERSVADAMKHLGVDEAPDVAALLAQVKEHAAEIEMLNRETRRRDFSGFTDFKQFITFDRQPARLVAAQQEMAALTRELAAARIARAQATPGASARLKPGDQSVLDEYFQAVALARQAATKSYPKPAGAPLGAPAVGRRTLFPTGHFEELPLQPIDEKKTRVALALQPPADAEQRQARFAQRNSPAGLAELCASFAKVLIPGTPGLEEFEKLAAAGKPAEALAAYRAYFFAKLADPEGHGAATENILFELTRDRGRRELLLRPSPLAVEQNMAGAAVAQLGSEIVVGRIGAPGSVNWVPRGLAVPASAANDGRVGKDPFWQSAAGKEAKRTLEFYRYLRSFPGDRAEYYSGGFFPALLWSYAITGNRGHLARWCEYLDDYAMNARRDEDDFAFGTRNATELETQAPRATLNLLRIMLDERPELARDFDPATLARWLMQTVADDAPYLIRARRAEMANWGIMGLCHQVHLSRFLSEFKAEAYFNRECWRLWNANMIQHRTLDGENIEAWDDGHNYVTQEYSRESFPFARWPAEVDRWDLTDLYDQLRTDQRSKLIHVSPGGFYWPHWEARYPRAWNTLQTYYRPDTGGGEAFNLIETEPEALARLRTLMSSGHPADGRLPDHFSDHSPYAAMSYLRESWQPGADSFVLQNFRTRSQSQADCSRTMYSLAKNDRVLVEAQGLVVDGKPDNRYQNAVRTGGKTDYCAQTGRDVWPERFHTSARFDFAEALQDAPYALPRLSQADAFGLYRTALPAPDPHPITEVTVLRQCFGVRGEGLWLVCDRIQSASGSEHEYTQFFGLPTRLGETGLADRVRLLAAAGNPLVEVDEAAQRVRTLSPGFDNVSLYCVSPAPLKFANLLDAKRAPMVLPGTALERLQAPLKAGQPAEKFTREHLLEPLSVRWSGTGPQILLTALASRAANDNPAEVISGDLRKMERLSAPGGVLGGHAVTSRGTEVWLESGPQPENSLHCGPLQARAETLLVTQAAGRPAAGIALGCTEIAGAKLPAGAAADFEFELSSGGRVASMKPIHRPIGTVRILPERGVFTEPLEVSFALPGEAPGDVELRYTLDGSDPTLGSALYTAPFRIATTTMVKVRRFRKGLTATPWTFTGTESGKTMSAIFRQQSPLPPAAAAATEPGLRYEYFEADWPTLFSYAGAPGVLEPKSRGTVAGLLQAPEVEKTRATDRAFAIRYEGFLQVPATGVYTFFAPPPLYTAAMDAGYDLRLFIDGQEWLPSPRVHAENTWSIALQAGPHRLQVAYVDYRWKQFRNEYWMAWQPEEMWQGVPVLEVTGLGMPKQPLPDSWLRRQPSP